MSDSLPPPSKIPGHPGGSGLYIAGAVLFALLIGGLLYWKSSSSKPVATPVAVESAQPVAPPTPVLDAPPPPPPPEEIDAGAPVAAATGKKPSSADSAAPAANGPCSKCDQGKASGALRSALTNAAGGARGCYNRALRTSEVSGSMTVSVQVSSTGSVCSASIVNDTVGSGEISSCVLAKFKGHFPPPESGCVTVNIPISFKIKQ